MNPCNLSNRTPFAAQPFLLADGEGRDALVIVVKASFYVTDGVPRLVPAETSAPVRTAAEYNGEPGVSSVRFAEDSAPFKPATDVVVVGHAHAPQKGTTQMDVALRVGPLQKTVRVFGDRFWVSSLGMRSITRPQPFERIPLIWERAYGGHDESVEEAVPTVFDPRNPVGTGFHVKGGRVRDGAKLPNLERPAEPIRDYEDRPQPAGFGFVGPHWEPRARRAGTYNDAWRVTRCPLLPADFDPAFHNAAPDEQIVPGYLKGNEPIEVTGVRREGRWSFTLPGLAPPSCTVRFARRTAVQAQTNLDTVVLDGDAAEVLLTWRACVTLREPPHEVRVIEVTS